MNYFDIILAAIILFSAFKGFKKGFVYQLIDLFAFLFLVYLIINYSNNVGKIVKVFIDVPGNYQFFIGATFIFIVLVVSKFLLYNVFIKDLVKGPIDRIFGLVFSVFKSALVISFIIFVINITKIINLSDLRKSSLLFLPIENIFPILNDLFQLNIPKF